MLTHLTSPGWLKCSCGFCKKEYSVPITKDELLQGRDIKYATEYTPVISDNLDKLLVVMNKVRDAYSKPMVVTSGWRPPQINAKTPGAAPQSNHMKGLAVDIADADGALMNWVLRNLDLMKDLGLYFEDFRYTPTWCHFQCVPPASGKRIFVPYAGPAPAPGKWDGIFKET